MSCCNMLGGVNTEKQVIYEALFELSHAISGHSDLNSLLRALFRSLKRVVNFDFLVLFLHDEFSDTLRLNAIASADKIEGIEPPAISADEGNPAEWVWRNQKPIVIPQVEKEDRWPEIIGRFRERGISSFAIVPMTTGERRLGALAFGSIAVTETSQEEMDFIQRMTSEFAATINSYLTQAKYLHERDRLQLLFDVTNSLVSKLSWEALFSAVADQLSKVVKCDVAALALLDKKTGELFLSGLHTASQVPVDIETIRALPDGLPSGEALSTGKPVLVDVSDFQRFPSAMYQRWVNSGLCCGCSIPLVTPNSVLGTIELGRYTRQPFSQEDIELLVQVAHQVAIALENSLAYRELAEMKEMLAVEKSYLEDDIRIDQNLGDMLGDSPAFQAVLRSLQVVAPTDATVLILGETGTGKELIARAIHGLSGRSRNIFVKVNCAAIPASLLESELFGHEKGAFTGALAQRIGRFELANHGTLFLDEIGEIPLELQSKLLRAIQEQEFERLGTNRTTHTDIRFIAASNRNLKAMMEKGEFRSDLYYRLHVFPLPVPPLRERNEDIPLLARYFTQKFAHRMGRRIEAISPAAVDMLTRYEWPGNIRELQNVIERSVVLTRGPLLELAMPEVGPGFSAVARKSDTGVMAERKRILQALKDARCVVGGPDGAAARLGLKRTTLQARMKKLGITREYQ
ncbi:MAG: Sigma-54 dependent transcriptional regulator (Modular protein) [Acidobacteria bacterium]|nr:Sigma-54 dependent transcriptional regulator (Modular protein) [Acidobacteriota bacterium]